MKIHKQPIIPNSINMQTTPGPTCVFMTAGRMIYRKGYQFLLDAFAQIPADLNYELRMIGTGTELQKLQQKCNSNKNLSAHTVFTGLIPHSEIENEYKKANVFIMPSIRETTGTVLLEAMAKGIPVITINRFGGAILLNNSTGWLYEGDDKISYIRNLSQILMECIANPEEVKRRGQNARKSAEEYTWEIKNQHYQNLYRQLLDE